MTRSTQVMALMAALSLSLLCIEIRRLTASTSQRDSTIRQLGRIRADVRELHRISSQSATRLYGSPPDADVQAAVAGVLDQIGLPAAVARSIHRDSDRAIDNDSEQSRIRARDMRIELRSISPQDLGEFLKLWRDRFPAWIVRSISLRKSTARGSGPSEYDASVTCTATYIDTRANP